MTMGKEAVFKKSRAAAGEVNTSYRAVGMWYFCIRSLAKTLLDSIRAALASGPKQRMPAAWRASTHPRARGSSGATTAKSTAWLRAKATMAPMSVAPISGTQTASAAMPPLPGRT